MKSSLALLTTLALVSGCSGKGNTGQPERNFSWEENGTTLHLWEQVPWANHGLPRLDATDNLMIAATPVFPPIADGMADPGSQPVDCSALEGIELSPYVDTFEPYGGGLVGVAPGWSSYDDGSDASFSVPGDASWYPVLQGIPGGPPGIRGSAVFGMASGALAGERPLCDGAPNEWALHYRGGRFNWYGGGVAHPFAAGKLNEPCPPGSDLCPSATALDVFGPPKSGDSYVNDHSFWDASQYDGIVFWARRGPEGATGLLVGLQDKYNSDDLARQNETFCKRFKPCVPDCTLGRSCIAASDGFNRCLPDDFPEAWNTEKVDPSLRELLFPRCKGATKDDTCVPPSYYQDPDFDNTECKWHSFTGREEGYWCSGESPPPAAPERCGDNYVAPISLSTDWQLFKLPFESFQQVGFGKRAPKIDLKTLYSIAFQFTVGYTDVYIDNLSLYRNKQP